MQRFIFLVISVIISGCEGFFEREVYVELPEHEPRIVVNSIIDPSDTIMRIMVAKSVTIDSFANSKEFSTAEVTLRVNGTPLTDLYFDSANTLNPFLNYFLSEYQPQAGDTYEILVEVPGYPAVQSETFLPKGVTISKAVFAGIRYDIDGEAIQVIKFKIEDIPDESNFYEVSLYYELSSGGATGSVHSNRHTLSDLKSPVSFLTDTNNGLAFTDAAFENSSIELEISTFYEGELYMSVRSTNESYYEYVTSFYTHQLNQIPDLFSGEPVPVYSNIKGGYGIFTAYSTTEVKVERD